MQPPGKIDDAGFCPSFSCYSSDSLVSMAAAKASREDLTAQSHEFGDVDAEDFDFPLVLGDNGVSSKEIDSEGRTVFPVFNGDFVEQNEVDREVKSKDVEAVVSDSTRIPLRKLFVYEREESPSSSSSESDELDSIIPSRTFCLWRPKAEVRSSSHITKSKKSSSTGSGSKRWRIRDLVRRSNSEPMVFMTSKKAECPKQKWNSGELSRVSGKLKTQSPSMHEQFYVQKRAQNQDVKRKSYLPYRQDLVGLFANVNGGGKIYASILKFLKD